MQAKIASYEAPMAILLGDYGIPHYIHSGATPSVQSNQDEGIIKGMLMLYTR